MLSMYPAVRHGEPMEIAPPGLKGLAVADTTLGAVRGEEGFFHYREHDAAELARSRTLEDVWTLQLDGALPPDCPRLTPGPRRGLPPVVAELVDESSSRITDPMSTLRMGMLALADAEGRGPMLDRTPEQRRDDAIRLAAVVPAILARHHRRRQGLDPVHPDPALGHAADYLVGPFFWAGNYFSIRIFHYFPF